MKNLTSKLLNENLKKGWTAYDFAKYLECTKPEFEQTLERTFNGKALQNFRKHLAKNAKIQKRNTKHPVVLHEKAATNMNDTAKITGEIVAPTKTVAKTETVTAITREVAASTNTVVVNSTQATAVEESAKISLDELLQKKKACEADLDIAEKWHQQVVSARHFTRQTLLSYEKNIHELETQLEAEKEKVFQFLTIYENQHEEMLKLDEEIRSIRLQHEQLVKDIHEALKITIFVYANGELDIDSQKELPNPDWNACYTEIREDEKLETLTVRQIKALAKVLVLAKELKAVDLCVEVSFEDKISEEYFRATLS